MSQNIAKINIDLYSCLTHHNCRKLSQPLAGGDMIPSITTYQNEQVIERIRNKVVEIAYLRVEIWDTFVGAKEFSVNKLSKRKQITIEQKRKTMRKLKREIVSDVGRLSPSDQIKIADDLPLLKKIVSKMLQKLPPK